MERLPTGGSDMQKELSVGSEGGMEMLKTTSNPSRYILRFWSPDSQNSDV